MQPEQSDELFALRAAGRDIVEAIKDIKHLQKNLSVYMASDNQPIRKEYDLIRARLASVLRATDVVRHEDDDTPAFLSLDAQKLAMAEYESRLDIQLNSLIRSDLITPAMSISLMNDSGYASDLTKNLLRMGEILFSSGEVGLGEAERSVSLDEDEVDEFLQESKSANRGNGNEHQ
jgi:phosphate:Na+ symporter